MAKDPAMLWYWSDWHSGTSLLSRFIKGCYIDLLHAQFNNGRLSLEEIKICLGSDFGQVWPTLQKKFKQDESGLFFNERLEFEKIARANFCKSRRTNKLGKTLDKSHEKQVFNRMENENVNTNKTVLKGVQGENDDPDQMPLGHDMYMLFMRTNPTYPQFPSKDIPAIMDLATFIHFQSGGSQVNMLYFTKEERALVFNEWGRWCEWYKTYGGNDDLAYIQKFKTQKIFSELKNGKKNASNQQFVANGKSTGGKSAGAIELLNRFEESLRAEQ